MEQTETTIKCPNCETQIGRVIIYGRISVRYELGLEDGKLKELPWDDHPENHADLDDYSHCPKCGHIFGSTKVEGIKKMAQDPYY